MSAHMVYAAYAPSGALLYIGITSEARWPQRYAKHMSTDPQVGSHWAHEPGVQWRTVRSGLDRTTAEALEQRLIAEWNPLHNTVHSRLGKIGRNARAALNQRQRPEIVTESWMRQQWVHVCRGARLAVRLGPDIEVRPMLGARHPASTSTLQIFDVFPCEGRPLSFVREAAEFINAGFRAYSTEVRIPQPNIGLVLVAFDDPFPAKVPTRPVPAGATDLPYAVTMAGETVSIPVVPGEGQGNGIVIAGMSGSGKSSTVTTLLTLALQSERVDLWLADPKRVDLAPFHGAAVRVETTRPGWKQMLSDACDEMDRRYQWMQANGYRDVVSAADDPDCPRPLWIVLEELNSITTGEGNRNTETNALRRIVREGRAAGMCPILITQSPYVAALPGDIADNLARYIVHKTKRHHQTDAATGNDSDAAPAHELVLGDFHAYTRDPRTGEVRRIKSMFTEPRVVREVVEAHTPVGVIATRELTSETTDTRPSPPTLLCSSSTEGGRGGLDAAPAGPGGALAGVVGSGRVELPVVPVERVEAILAELGLSSFEGAAVSRAHPLATSKGKVTRAKLGCWELEPHGPVPCPGCGRTVTWPKVGGEGLERVAFVVDGVPRSLCRSCGGRVSRG